MANSKCLFKMRCTRIDFNDSTFNQHHKDGFFNQFERFYRDRMNLNKIQRKNPNKLQDQLVRLYKDTIPCDRYKAFSLTTRESSSSSQPKKKKYVNYRPLTTTGRREIQQKPQPELSNLLSITPKQFVKRRPFQSKDLAKTTYIDILKFDFDYCDEVSSN